jgi:hypothetical protein
VRRLGDGPMLSAKMVGQSYWKRNEDRDTPVSA